MKEYSVQALVLDKEDLAEADARVFLYTRDHGKIVAKIKSAKKPLSKLNAHLEPGSLARVRIIRQGPHVADALCESRVPLSPALVTFLHFVRETTLEWHADRETWELVEAAFTTQVFDYHALLAAQGFDPRFATCYHCQQPRPDHFFFHDATFWCSTCRAAQEYEMTCSPGFIALSSS